MHVAFDKAAKILNVRIIKVPVDPATGAADVNAMQRAITNRTCMMVGSALSFPSGVTDPIEALGAICKQHDIPLHVDACLGGFTMVFAHEAGFHDFPRCDFSVPGVTSISIDTHKYGQTPKGTSVLLLSPNTKATPTHVHLDWVGGSMSHLVLMVRVAELILQWHGRCYATKAGVNMWKKREKY